MELVRTYSLSKMRAGESVDILAQKALPIGIAYKMYLDDRGIDNYCLVINTNDELDIHFIQDKKLQLKDSIVLINSSLEYYLNDVKSDKLITKILDLQLDTIFNLVEEEKTEKHYKINNIIYLENTTNYINYCNKCDSYLVTDQLWKLRELDYLQKYSELMKPN